MRLIKSKAGNKRVIYGNVSILISITQIDPKSHFLARVILLVQREGLLVDRGMKLVQTAEKEKSEVRPLMFVSPSRVCMFAYFDDKLNDFEC